MTPTKHLAGKPAAAMVGAPAPAQAQLDCLPIRARAEPTTLRVTLTDNTQRKQAEIDRIAAQSRCDKVHRLGGQVQLDDLPGQGSRITVRLPLATLSRVGNAAPSRDIL